jgi:hypothetical protein
MDFVEGLPAAIDTPEIAFDDIGRAELLNGRLRLTFYREVMHPDGTVSRLPAICLICSPEAWRRARRHSVEILAMIETGAEKTAVNGLRAPLPQVH